MSNVVNMVASTQLTESIDLYDVSNKLGINYEAEQFPGMVYRVATPKVCILLFRSGKAVVTGAKSEEDVTAGLQVLHDDLTDNGYEMWPYQPEDISIENIVVTYEYGSDLDLSHLIFTMPFDKTEYEPEVFPGLIYRIDEPKSVCLVFSSGKCVITGCKSEDEAELATEQLVEQLDVEPLPE
ncbi:MAG: TATA-box-binding protein [Candidatus Thorarchaeota archaeon]|jgi:transcription initiation factor TFIID TATA-box-binding protein